MHRGHRVEHVRCPVELARGSGVSALPISRTSACSSAVGVVSDTNPLTSTRWPRSGNASCDVWISACPVASRTASSARGPSTSSPCTCTRWFSWCRVGPGVSAAIAPTGIENGLRGAAFDTTSCSRVGIRIRAPNGATLGIKDGTGNASHHHARVDQEFAVFLVFLGEPSGKATGIGDNVECELAVGFQGGRSHDSFGFHRAVRKPICLQISGCHALRRRHAGLACEGRPGDHQQPSRAGDEGVTFEIDCLSGRGALPHGGKVGHYGAGLVLEEAAGIVELGIPSTAPGAGQRGLHRRRPPRAGRFAQSPSGVRSRPAGTGPSRSLRRR